MNDLTTLPFIILQDSLHNCWVKFSDPVHVVKAHTIEAVRPALEEVETRVDKDGLTAVGFITYEAAAAFDPALTTHPPVKDLPLMWFGLFQGGEIVPSPASTKASDTLAPQWKPEIDQERYTHSIEEIKTQIARGYTYQVNYTYRLHTEFEEDPWDFFVQLVRAQASEYMAYLHSGHHIICSASPELFFTLDGETLRSKPMKGTAPRGLTWAQDEANRSWLAKSTKNRAENLMIVDMIRNDMGRVAQIGRVEVPALFEAERYPTVLQMTSTVTAQTKAGLTEIMTALFPCASITGAPKVSTMQIIRGLEASPRGIYTGAIGFYAPNRQAQFNVAIRTATIDTKTRTAFYGVGGGIVWDSTAESEYHEAQLKAAVLTRAQPAFSLLETMRWSPEGGFDYFKHHMRRLEESARYFNFPLSVNDLNAQLEAAVSGLPHQAHKIRLLLNAAGVITIEAQPLDTPQSNVPLRCAIAHEPINPSDIFLYHKTTHRDVYTRHRQGLEDFDDVLMWNPRGELTEFTIYNLVVKIDGAMYTPPVESGLLAGTLRAALLEEGKITTRVLTRDDLQIAEAVYAINSVRGWREVQLD